MYPKEICCALNILKNRLGTDQIFIKRISSSVFEGRIIFYTDDDDVYYIVDLTRAHVEVLHRDTWRHPEHRIILKEGD